MNDIDDQIKEKVPSALRERVLSRVEPTLERNRKREQSGGEEAWWSFLFRPIAIGGLATAGFAAAVVFILSQPQKGDAPVAAVSAPLEYELEMLAEAELLEDLIVLENWEKLRKEWKPKKT